VTRRVAKRSRFLRLVGSDVDEERLAALVRYPPLLDLAARDQRHADEDVEQDGHDDRDDK